MHGFARSVGQVEGVFRRVRGGRHQPATDRIFDEHIEVKERRSPENRVNLGEELLVPCEQVVIPEVLTEPG